MNSQHKQTNTSQVCADQVASNSSTPTQYPQIKLAMDVHAPSIVVGRMIEGAKPQPPQTFKPADFLVWAQKQVALAKEVFSCYEAGPTGFWLHRRLTALGVTNYVVCPTRLDERVDDQKDLLALSDKPVLRPSEEKFFPSLAGLQWREQHLKVNYAGS